MDSVVAATADVAARNPSLPGTSPNITQELTGQTSPPSNASWYTPGTDFCLYAIALDACRTSKARLAKLKLTVEEKQLLVVPPTDASSLISKLNFIVEGRQGKKGQAKWQKRTSGFFLSFCQVVEKTSALVATMLPQSPEYTVTFGVLMLLFKAVVTKSDREEALMTYLETLAAKLPVVEFYKSAFPTTAIKIAVANIFSEMMKLLDEALVYYRSPRYGKLVDAIIQPTESKFKKYMSQIDIEVQKLADLKDIAHEAQAIDIHEMVTQTGKGREPLKRTSIDVLTCTSGDHYCFLRLDTKMENMRTFEMIRYMHDLERALFSSPDALYWDPDEALGRLAKRGFRLSLKDHWDNNGILERLVEWSRASDPCPLLWVGGQSGNQDPWVTELSLDIVLALLPQPITILYVFCSDIASASGSFTPAELVRLLIAQLLRLHPRLVYENPLSYSALRLQNASGFNDLWQILEELASSLTSIYVIIDRIEECGVAKECTVDDDTDLKTTLLPSLAQLVHDIVGSRAIVTSIYEVPAEAFEHDLEEMVDDVYIAT
ncbi:Vegetative incompatibility protein HET-E-1 [Apiospora phragmitis]|uniref:Vegetative incompatibility protein HET-E-1 n=1 Tax=Apiospora phragmitis TaxID=2905665 RepID=A0ABR1T328_9PEZI